MNTNTSMAILIASPAEAAALGIPAVDQIIAKAMRMETGAPASPDGVTITRDDAKAIVDALGTQANQYTQLASQAHIVSAPESAVRGWQEQASNLLNLSKRIAAAMGKE